MIERNDIRCSKKRNMKNQQKAKEMKKWNGEI